MNGGLSTRIFNPRAFHLFVRPRGSPPTTDVRPPLRTRHPLHHRGGGLTSLEGGLHTRGRAWPRCIAHISRRRACSPFRRGWAMEPSAAPFRRRWATKEELSAQTPGATGSRSRTNRVGPPKKGPGGGLQADEPRAVRHRPHLQHSAQGPKGRARMAVVDGRGESQMDSDPRVNAARFERARRAYFAQPLQ